jgi:hypothetical protein
MLTSIANGESGASVRTKLNTCFDMVARAVKHKPSDTSRTGTPADDPHLVIAVTSGEIYLVRYSFVWSLGGPTDDPSYTWTVPSVTGNMFWMDEHTFNGTGVELQYYSGPPLPTIVPTAHSGINLCKGWLRLQPSAAGNVALNWNCGGGGTSVLKAGSFIELLAAS